MFGIKYLYRVALNVPARLCDQDIGYVIFGNVKSFT